MNKPLNLPEDKHRLLLRVVEVLRSLSGVAAIVLGGSYARGTQRPGSDLDVGLYYREQEPFSISDIRRIAREVSIQGEPVVTELYSWGPWVNGGAWIHTAAGKMDFLYRNLDQVQRTIGEARQGIVHHDYDQQPVYGFYSVIYLAEIEVCYPLYDPESVIAGLKRQVEDYPSDLREKVIQNSLWSAEFTLLHARDFATAGDVYNTAGCLSRVSANLTQALFAINRKYFISDKKVMAEIARFPVRPTDYESHLTAVLASPGSTPAELGQAVASMQGLWQEVVELVGDRYHPSFNISG